MKRVWFLFCAFVIWVGSCAPHSSLSLSQTSKQSTHFVDSLLAQMTLDEKIGQLTLFASHWEKTGPTLTDDNEYNIKKGNVGAIFSARTVKQTSHLQHLAVDSTRLGIPLLFGYDVIHGFKTIFPVPLAESASWNLNSIEQSARIAAVEASASGVHWTFAPMVDIARDPRWGRIMEGAGEDAYLGSLIAKARVHGFQGDDLSKGNTILACAKHFAAYGAAQAGREYHTVDISNRSLWETYLPPFRAAVDAGVRTFMTSFNELNGIPATGNSYLLKDILRHQWAFDGMVVTDYTSINEMMNHGVVGSLKEAGELALNAGVDMDMQGAVFLRFMKTSIQDGRVDIQELDRAVHNVLMMKYELGLFQDPYKYCDKQREKNNILTPAHREFARKIAKESIVLLKNKKGILPLSQNENKKIAIIGPLADSPKDMLGAWHAAGEASDVVGFLAGLKNQKNKVDLLYAKGCEPYGGGQAGFAKAKKIAESSDYIILCVGETAAMSGEAASRANIGLPGQQLALAKMCVKTGKPVIVVLSNGRPLAIPWLQENVDAIVETWFLGVEAGNALADVIFGHYNPSGRLPVTFPRALGQVSIYYNMKNTGRPFDAHNKFSSKYLDVPNSPLYPFGYGLSYTQFEYGEIHVSKNEFSRNEPLKVSVSLKNIGKVDGVETVQLYIHDLVGSVTRPVKELKSFQQIKLMAGEKKKVVFSLSEKDFRFYDKEMNWVSEPGEFDIFVGANADVSRKIRVALK